MHIYLQWDPWMTGTKKERDSQEYKTLDLVIVGQVWDSCRRPWISSPTLNYTFKITAESQAHFSGASKVISCPWKAKQNGVVYSGSFCRLRQSKVLSSKESLPKRLCTPGHIPVEPSQSTLSCIFLCPGCTFSIRCTHFCQPLPFLHQV